MFNQLVRLLIFLSKELKITTEEFNEFCYENQIPIQIVSLSKYETIVDFDNFEGGMDEYFLKRTKKAPKNS